MTHTEGAEALVRALINSHRELSPEVIRMLLRHMGHESASQRSKQRRARVVVEAADRDIDLGVETADSESLIPVLTDGRWPFRDRGDRESPAGGADEEPLTLLRSFLRRTTQNPSHGIQLFNHLRSSSDLHWIVIPIGARNAEHATTGTLRVGVDPTDHTPREATLAIAVGSGVWWLSWTLERGGVRLVSFEAESGAPEIPESLLARISGRGHTNTDQFQNGDGFSGTSSEVNNLGVDEYG
jgi:hypothetical protein